jgi:hypothetical protein
VSRDDVVQVDTPVQQLTDLDVGISVRRSTTGSSSASGKIARCEAFFGAATTSSSIHAAGERSEGVSERPNALVVLVKLSAFTPAFTAALEKSQDAGDVGLDEAMT